MDDSSESQKPVLQCICLNARSLLRKCYDLLGYLSLLSVDINYSKADLHEFQEVLSHVPWDKGQWYDGASTMKGPRSGVAKQLLEEEPKAIYTHCYGHSLNW